MNEYPKIQSIYKRDKQGRFLIDEWAEPWMEYLDDLEWIFTEKVDGTNIRVMFNGCAGSGALLGVRFGGRTDKAQIQTSLLDELQLMFSWDLMSEVFSNAEAPVCLYGEGFGAGIQKGGGLYGAKQNFILFDVKVGDWWLKQEAVEDVAHKLGILLVPIVGHGTLTKAASMALTGFGSWIANPPTGQDTPEAEGLVCRPAVDLFDRGGRRIIVKVKTKDMRRAVARDGEIDRAADEIDRAYDAARDRGDLPEGGPPEYDEHGVRMDLES